MRWGKRSVGKLLALVAVVVGLGCSPAAGTAPAAGAGAPASQPAAAAPPSGGASAAGPAASAPAAPASAPAAAAPAQASAPPAATKLLVGAQGRPDQAHLQLGIDGGHFVRQGIDVELVQINTGAEMVPALATNQIQVGNGAPSSALYNAFNRGINIRIVADYAHVGTGGDTTLAMLVRKEPWDTGAVRSLRDLSGRTMALAAPPGQLADLFYTRALEKEGISGAGVNVEYMPFPDIIGALGSARADGGMLTEPFVTQVVQQGLAEVLYPAGAVIPDAILSVLQYSPQFAAEQPDLATRFMVAYLQGVRDHYDAFHLKQNRDAAIEHLVKALPIKDPRVWESYPPQYVDLNGKVNVDDLKDSAAFYARQGTLEGSVPDIEKYVDPQFAEAAVRQIGRR
jgi:NitT/TauT family transport system substrate-binding protein